jgi:hypothetical protein
VQTTNERGIVISAGGRYYLPQAIVLLRILRYKHRSTLPVEIFWHGDDEMDNTTLAVRGFIFLCLDSTKLAQLYVHIQQVATAATQCKFTAEQICA